ncbi:DUF2336 domain-containing protein [Rhodocista pekingensis]|uniref:DUF2336 domain-containing protein n=1 Tax=Rhodocista pekingensis TaxID=201185 RepID=A0ABW2KP55_9PROT
MSRTPTAETPRPGTRALSAVDVKKLLADRSAQARIDTMSKVVAELSDDRLEPREAELAREVLLRFARDAEVAVREAVAWQIHNSPLLTDDLARTLAEDVGRVAFPVLRFARLADDFLLEVLSGRDAEKHVAIAGSARISPAVADAIVETANLPAIGTLLRNDGAEIPTPTLERVADRYGDVAMVAEPLADRPELPPTVVEKLIHRVSEDLRRTLVERYHLTPSVVADLVGRGREAATMLLLAPLTRDGTDVELLARHLHVNGRLTPTLLFRALCAGDLALFTAGMAVRAGIAVANARILLADDGPLGVRSLFERAQIHPHLTPPFRSALKVVRETGYEGGAADRRAFQLAVLARVHAECGHIEEHAVDELLMQLFDGKSEEEIDRAMEMAGLPFLPLRSCDDHRSGA